MTRTMAALIAALLILPGASPQDDAKADKERAKEEAKKREDDAKAALKAYREMLGKAKSADDIIEALQKLELSDPHPLIRVEFTRVLENDRSIDVRIAAAAAMGKFKKDNQACDVLLNNARSQKDEGVKKKCIQRFGAIAPFGRSMDLKRFFNDENNAIVKEALEAIEEIKSVRMLKPLIDLLGELEQIKEDQGDSGGGPPLPGVPQNDSSNNQRLKRKRELTDPTRKAINTLWKKYDSKTKLNNATEAIAAWTRNRAFLDKIQIEEDKEDKAGPPKDD
ncbi:MAG TPA: hypothetical protein VJU16_02205, partial [Planctomycetota bacterium]|nr:hypothetical protein [Planctomycetota bacterium]